MRTAAMLQLFSHVSGGVDTYKMVCWRSGCIVVGGRRRCRLTPNQTWEFSPTWFVQDVCTKGKAFLRDSAVNILSDDIASTAGVA